MYMEYICGRMMLDGEFVAGHVGIEDGEVIEVGAGTVSDPIVEGIIMPTMVDAHTHLADHFIGLPGGMPLSDLVAPPDGLKHRMLRDCHPAMLDQSLRLMVDHMFQRGVSRFIDFRECGADGSRALAQIDGPAAPIIMGRPDGLRFDPDELDAILRYADGIGISAVSDWEEEELMALSDHVRSKGCRLALHASEAVREDIDLILDLRPDHLVHMTMATDLDLELCASHGIPIVVCPRSNMFFGIMPPLRRMLEAEVELALGTDNAMVALPDMLTEVEFAARLLLLQGARDLSQILRMGWSIGRNVLIDQTPMNIEEGCPCDLMVLQDQGGDAVTDLTLRSGGGSVLMVSVGGREWRSDQLCSRKF